MAEKISTQLGLSGVKIWPHTEIESVDQSVLKVKSAGEPRQIQAEEIVLAAGLRPNTEGMSLESAGVYLNEKGFAVINEECRTAASHIPCSQSRPVGRATLNVTWIDAELDAKAS